VIDPGVLVRGLLRPRPSAALTVVELALEGVRLTGIVSPVLLEEVLALLSRPEMRRLTRPPLEDALIDRFVRHIASRFELTPGALRGVEGLPPAGVDNPAVAAALEGRADAIISDDPALEDLASIEVPGFQRVDVCEPGAFLRRGLR
jgi:hypothetical protein